MEKVKASDKWNAKNLAHRFTVSFFTWKYQEKPEFITATSDRNNNELVYFNIADSDNNVNANICAGLMVNYMEAQGIPYHSGKSRKECFNTLTEHLNNGEGKVLFTADIIDFHFKFLGEED